MAESSPYVGDLPTTAGRYRYFLCSITDQEPFARSVRTHWAIENQQHWVLDVQFREEGKRSRKDHSAGYLSVIRRAALNLIRQNDSSKPSIGRRRRRTCAKDNYRLQLLFGPGPL